MIPEPGVTLKRSNFFLQVFFFTFIFPSLLEAAKLFDISNVCKAGFGVITSENPNRYDHLEGKPIAWILAANLWSSMLEVEFAKINLNGYSIDPQSSGLEGILGDSLPHILLIDTDLLRSDLDHIGSIVALHKGKIIVVAVGNSKKEDSLAKFLSIHATSFLFFANYSSLDLFLKSLDKIASGNNIIESGLIRNADPSIRFDGKPVRSAILETEENPLTRTEVKVVRAIGDGLSNRQIAERYGKSRFTVRIQVVNILRKLGVSNRKDAHILASNRGWL